MALTEIPSELSNTPSIVDNGNSTAITIDSSENATFAANVGIGTSSPRSVTNYSVVGINGTSGSAIDFELGEALKTTFTQTAGQFEINVVPALPLIFKTSNTERLRIDGATGNVGVGNSNPSAFNSLGATDKLVIGDSTVSNLTLFGTNYGSLAFADSDTSSSTAQYSGLIQYYHANNSMQFYTNSTEAFRITAARDMYFGTTSGSAANVGHIMQANGVMFHTANATTGMYLRRLNSDGSIIEFRKNSTTVGSIGVIGGNNLYIHGDTIGLGIGDDNIYPTNSSGTSTDAITDIGDPSARFRNVYRSGSTYSTSDRNMKQDIRELTGAERNVAVAAKGLLKAFRFIDAVDRDGDSANIHFGIIAQELAEAFAAEGLEANDYQVYKTTVETDEYGNEQTKLNVCYENLLAFIISAI